MLIISHRGNIVGTNPSRENSPEYILEAISQGFDVEVDIWVLKVSDEEVSNQTQIYFGHDFPTYRVEESFIKKHNDKIWFHAKNLEALEYCLLQTEHTFWHENDTRTITSNGYIWTYPGRQVGVFSILVLTEEVGVLHLPLPDCAGICTDFALMHRNVINEFKKYISVLENSDMGS